MTLHPDLPPKEFRQAGYAVIDRLVDYYASLSESAGTTHASPPHEDLNSAGTTHASPLRVFPTATPLDLEPLFAAPPPEAGEPLDSILSDWETKILPNSAIQGHPRFFSWVNGGGTQVGALAEALAAGLNPNLGGWRASHAASVIENQTIRWIAELMGLAPGTGGLFVSGGTMANTTALRMALAHTATWDIANEGLQSPNRPKQLTIYMGDHEKHISLTKAVDLLGLGRNTIRLVPSHDDYTIDTAALTAMLDADIAAGMTPFAIVGHCGSINVGAFDDFHALADIAEARKLWLHLDGACGALAAWLPEMRHLTTGMERADSVSFDAHKWMGVPYECGAVLVKNPEILGETFRVTASYLHEEPNPALEPYDFFDRGPQMSRGWRALKVWMSMRLYGAEGYRTFFRQTIRCAQRMHELVAASNDFEVVQPEPALYIYAFRYNPGGLDDDALDALNAHIADEIKRQQIALVMTTRIHGRVTQRISVANHRTTIADIEAVFGAMREIGASATL